MKGTRLNYKDEEETYYYFEQRFLGIFWIPLYSRAGYHPRGVGGSGGCWGMRKCNNQFTFCDKQNALEHYKEYILDSSVKYRGFTIRKYYCTDHNHSKFKTYFVINGDYSRYDYAGSTTWNYHLTMDSVEKAIDVKLWINPEAKQVM